MDLARKDISNKLIFGNDRKNSGIPPFGGKRLFLFIKSVNAGVCFRL